MVTNKNMPGEKPPQSVAPIKDTDKSKDAFPKSGPEAVLSQVQVNEEEIVKLRKKILTAGISGEERKTAVDELKLRNLSLIHI